jgi:hypothetical protein
MSARAASNLPHSIGFSGSVCSCSSKASRREDLEIEEPVSGGYSAAFHFHPTLTRMLGAPLIRHQVVQVRQPDKKRLLAPFGMMEAFHREQLPLDRVLPLKAMECDMTWEAYEAHVAQLAANSEAYTPHRLHPPREGPALLQGLVRCGRGGERLTGRSHPRGGRRIVPDSRCQRAGIARGAPLCQRVPGRDRERAIGHVLREVVTPETIAVTLAVQDDLGTRAAEAARLRQLQVERAQYETDLAQRRSLRVDPENRLVADVLEAAWNAKLRALAEAREAAEQQRHQDQLRLSATEREAILELPRAFARFWHDPRTSPRERKRLARLLIEDVTVQKADSIIAQIRFKGGATRTLTLPLPPPFMPSWLPPPDTLAAIDRLLDPSTDAEVAVQLNAQEYRTFAGLPFQAMHVSQRRRAHGLKDRLTR